MSYRGVCVSKISKTFQEGIEALTIEQFPRRELKKGEVRIRVHSAALNYFDLLMLVGRYQTKPALPFTPVFSFLFKC
jgi:NADPH2:quinone reductase